jgi:N-acetyl-anhydromuramyl-L-alanine amidase AmpD
MFDQNGWSTNPNVIIEDKPAIQHGKIGAVRAIVLHRTGSSTGKSVLNAWNSKKEGTHFLIDENGKVYQTASIKSKCWHVGKLYSKCRQLESCTKEELTKINNILKGAGSWGKKFRLVTNHELTKAYPERYPHNHDSLGIEVVGVLGKTTNIYEDANTLQVSALTTLLDSLVTRYSLNLEDIYAHGTIAHKDSKMSEGVSVLKAYKIQKEQ